MFMDAQTKAEVLAAIRWDIEAVDRVRGGGLSNDLLAELLAVREHLERYATLLGVGVD